MYSKKQRIKMLFGDIIRESLNPVLHCLEDNTRFPDMFGARNSLGFWSYEGPNLAKTDLLILQANLLLICLLLLDNLI